MLSNTPRLPCYKGKVCDQVSIAPKGTKLAGFSLIEALITLFILTTGLLGVAASQGLAKRSVYESQQRTSASLIALNIAERLHLNRAELIANPSLYAVSSVKTTAESLPEPRCSNCNMTDRRTKDLLYWHSLLNGEQVISNSNRAIAGLSNADACIGYESDSGLVSIIVSWQSRNKLEDAADTSIELEKLCGTADPGRRQLIFQTLIRDA